MKPLNILVACEESQAVCKALRYLGHNAYSCDIISCSGGHPEWHIQDDVLKHINKSWDLIIAFPPCTNLCVSGARWFECKRNDGSQLASIDFFSKIYNAPCKYIAIENPVNIIGGDYIKKWFPNYSYLPKCSQVIQPWMFGHGETKATCLWLKNLPLLYSTDVVDGREHRIHLMPPSAERSKLRSKTYPGVAFAMAYQWSNFVLKEKYNVSEW